MKNQYSQRRFREINQNLRHAQRVLAKLPQVPEHFLAGYLATFISGVFEDCIEKIFVERASRSGDPAMVAYVEQTMHRTFRSPNFENIRKSIELFDPALSAALSGKLDEASKEALTFVVQEKNRLAHGDNPQFTLADLIGYYVRARRVVQAIESLLL